MNQLLLQSADGAQAVVSSHGAHVCSWQPAGLPEQLFLSKTSEMRAGVAIRGGIPVIFPQFAGLGSLPKHGFARTANWRLLRHDLATDGSAQAVFELHESIATLDIWPQVFRAELSVNVAGKQLEVGLKIDNSGDTAFSFTCALHTYLAVRDIAAASVYGLAGLQYRDSAQDNREGRQQEEALHITGEVDRIYAQVPATLELRQPHQTLQIQSKGFADAVVWNPGVEKAAALTDMEPGGYQRMLCIEAGNILQAITLQPGESWQGSQRLVVRD